MTGAPLAFLLALSVAAGPLDLDIYASPPSRAARAVAYTQPLGAWSPGSPLAMRGQSAGVRAFAHAGYATMGALGLAEILREPRSGAMNAAAAGFGAVSLINAWRGWKALREASPAN